MAGMSRLTKPGQWSQEPQEQAAADLTETEDSAEETNGNPLIIKKSAMSDLALFLYLRFDIIKTWRIKIHD